MLGLAKLLRSSLTLTRPATFAPAHCFTPSRFSTRSYFSPSFKMSAPHPVHSTSVPDNPAAAIHDTPSAAPEDGPAPAAGAAPKAAKAPKEKKAKKGDGLAAGMAALELDPKPEYLAHRIELFDKLKKEQDAKIAGQSSCAFLGSERECWL
jgi:hypothetical protein